jgi:hypothetical protein
MVVGKSLGPEGPSCRIRDQDSRAAAKAGGLFLPEAHYAGIVEVVWGCSFDVIVDFTSGGGGGKSDAKLVAEIESKAKIFVHEAKREAGLEIAFDHEGSFDVQDARAGHAGLHHFDELFAFEAGFDDEGESFGHGADLQSENGVHGELDGLAGAVRAEVKPLFTQHCENRFDFAKCFRFTANHENEIAFASAPIATGDGSVEITHTMLGAGRSHAASESGRDGAGVDVDAAAAKSGERAIVIAFVAPENLLEGGWIADDGEQNVGSSGSFARGFGESSSGGNKFLRARGGAIPDGKGVASLQKIHGHGATHEAETDESDFAGRAHEMPPVRRERS